MTLQEDRLKAQIVTNKNIVVEAGAGTGKTTLLIARLCISLLVAHVPAEKLVALTFTERAVAEIKTRLMEQLQKVIEDIRRKAVTDAQGNTVFDESIAPDEKNESTLYLIRTYFEKIPYTELLSRAEQAKTDLGRANIRTIHGFCAEILKLFPLEAGISPEVTIDNGQRGKVLFEAAWNTFLDKELGTQAPHRQAWEKILPEISLDALRCFAAELCSGKIEHYDYDACRNIIIDFLQKKSAQAFALSTAYLSPDCVKKRSIEKALIWAGQSFGRTIAFLTNKTDFPFIEEECPKIPGNAKPVKGWEATAWQEACSLIALAQKVTPEQQDLFLTAYGLVAPLVAQVRAQYAQLGLLSFDDLLVKTRNLLRDDLKVRRLLKEKFEALFIDEFQDTDPVQGEILLFLGEEKTTSAPCWEQVVLEPSKLFVVGDPKQSIYHFRGADISAYEAFTQMILTQGGEKCFLRENHRSLPEIIDTANAVCSLAMQEEPFFQPRYEPIFTNKQVRNQAVQWLFTKADPSAKADDFRQNQAEQIACWIRDNVGKMCLQNGKKLDYSDIALLARSNTTIRFYTDALRRHHIPFNAEINLDFLERQEINDLIMLLRAVSNPDDKTALAGVLRSPFGGFSDEEIYQIVRRGELSLFAKTQEEKLKDFYIQLNELSKLCGRLSPDKLLTYILQETFFPEACALAYEGERTLACLNQFAGLLQHYPAEQAVSLESFIVDVQQLQENPPKEFSVPCAEETLNAVSLLSVHKSKGLEAPVVILYDLSRKEKNYSSDSHLYSWKYHMHGVAVGKICDVNLAFLEEEKKKHTRCEEVRVLYVALTRAKEKLLLVGDGREQAQKGAFRFVAAGLFPDMENYPPHVCAGGLEIPVLYRPCQPVEEFIYHTSKTGVQQQAQTYPLRQWQEAVRLRKDAYARYSAHQKQLPSAGAELFSPEQRAGAELGTICHRVLERLLFGGEEQKVPQHCAQSAAAAGVPERAQEAVALLEPFVQSALFAAIRSCKVLACEMPFSILSENGAVESGVIDALLQKQDGSVWVIDYKTDRLKAGQERQVLQEKYARQLGIYKKAAEKIFPEKQVTATAVFVRTGTGADL